MFQIQLVNLPFAALEFPSLALTQLRSVAQADYGDRLTVQLYYANHDFARLTGQLHYQEFATSVRFGLIGLGDWLFRQSAFPELPDNTREYFARCFPTRDQATVDLRSRVLRLRDQVDSWLDAVISERALHEANLVGLTSMFSQNLACLALARKLKQRNPDITVVMGGANCEFPMGRELVQNCPSVDFVFSGPSLHSFSQFLQQQLEGRIEACHRIDGVFSRLNTNAPSPVPTQLIRPPDALPSVAIFGKELSIDAAVPLDYDDFLASLATWKEVEPALLFETSRGCWWGEKAHCTFCGLNGLTMKYRAMSPDNALRQFDELFRYAARLPRFTLQCVDNIIPREYLREVMPRLTTPDNVDIFYEVKSDLSESDLRILSAARVRAIQPGIESLATSTLKLMKKGTTSFQGVTLLKNCRQNGIVPQWNLLIGFPGETSAVYEKYRSDLPLLFHLPPPTGVFPVRFDRYSPYFMEAATYGLDLRPYDFYELIYPFAQDVLERLAYFFVDNNFSADYLVQMVQWIAPLSDLVARWRSRYHGDDGGNPAELRWDVQGPDCRLIDSRNGSRRVITVDALSQQILDALRRPLDRSRLATSLGVTDPASLDPYLATLQQRGLLFQEEGRMLSLVMGPHQNSNSSPDSDFASARRVHRIAST